MVQGQAPVVIGEQDVEGGARNLAGNAQSTRDALHEAGLARAQIARKQDDVPWLEQGRELGGEGVGVGFGGESRLVCAVVCHSAHCTPRARDAPRRDRAAPRAAHERVKREAPMRAPGSGPIRFQASESTSQRGHISLTHFGSRRRNNTPFMPNSARFPRNGRERRVNPGRPPHCTKKRPARGGPL